MPEQETTEFNTLQQKLAAKEAECKELHKQLHELRGHAQILQNKLSVGEIVCQNLEAELAVAGRRKAASS
jgi:hypothetical protein